MKKYIDDNPKATFKDLEHIFLQSLQGTHGVIQLSSKVSDRDKGIGGVKRFFADEMIKLTSGEEILVCNQWAVGNIEKFIRHVGALGYTITEK